MEGRHGWEVEERGRGEEGEGEIAVCCNSSCLPQSAAACSHTCKKRTASGRRGVRVHMIADSCAVYMCHPVKGVKGKRDD